jgi:hypothetical protein
MPYRSDREATADAPHEDRSRPPRLALSSILDRCADTLVDREFRQRPERRHRRLPRASAPEGANLKDDAVQHLLRDAKSTGKLERQHRTCRRLDVQGGAPPQLNALVCHSAAMRAHRRHHAVAHGGRSGNPLNCCEVLPWLTQAFITFVRKAMLIEKS